MRKLFLLIGYLIIICSAKAQKTCIWCGTLTDGKSDEPKKEMTIVIEKNRIIFIPAKSSILSDLIITCYNSPDQ